MWSYTCDIDFGENAVIVVSVFRQMICLLRTRGTTVGANIMFPCEVRSSRTSPEVEAKFVRS